MKQIYEVRNKGFSILFEDRRDANAFALSQGAASGWVVLEVGVIPSTRGFKERDDEQG